MTSSLDAVYERYKHLDGCLSDPEWCTSGEGAAIYAIAGELWRAVKGAREAAPEQCPHWTKIEHSDGDEWCCQKPRPPCEECIYQSQAAEHDAIRQDERDKIYKRLEAMATEAELVTCVTWSDIDCLFDELKDGDGAAKVLK